MARYREATPPGVHRHDKPGRWGGGDDSEELDVFAAERYFNGDDALWCARSSSSFSSAFRTGTVEHDRSVAATATAATSSSGASWNSRSALLPDGKVLAAAAAPSVVEAEPRGTESERPRWKQAPSSHLRRWLLGVAGCACVGGDGEESASADELCLDEVEDDNVDGAGGKTLTDGAGELFPGIKRKELAVGEAATVRVRPSRGRSLDDGDAFFTEKAAFSPVHVQLAGDGHRRAVNTGEFSTPILDAASTATLLHVEQRRKSSEMLRPLGDTGRSALVSAKKHDSAFTIVAGNTARGGGGLRAAAAGGGSRAAPRSPCISPCDTREDDTAPPSELGCASPPSEASVVWSVVTAEGAASCNSSSAASGYYYYFNGGGEDGAVPHAAGRSRRRRRRRGVTNGGGLLTCMGDKAVNAVKPTRSDGRNRPSVLPP